MGWDPEAILRSPPETSGCVRPVVHASCEVSAVIAMDDHVTTGKSRCGNRARNHPLAAIQLHDSVILENASEDVDVVACAD